MENAIVILVRLLVPLTILQWPLAGAIAALLADNLDIVFASLVDWGGLWRYHQLDKYLDTYYLAIMAIAAQRWEPPVRRTCALLFAYRLLGVILFAATDTRLFLFVFPALLEFFFIFYAAWKQFRPQRDLTHQGLAAALILLLLPKLGQEYTIHYGRWLDDVVAVDVIKDILNTFLAGLGHAFYLVP